MTARTARRLPRPFDLRKPVASLSITIPVPPPLNNLFVNVPGKGRVKSRDYRAWEKEANALLFTQGPIGCVRGPVSVSMFIARPKARSDLDGRAKAALDLIVSLGLIEDDSLVEVLCMSWDDALTDTAIVAIRGEAR